MMSIQSVIFPVDWSEKKATRWLALHKHKPLKVVLEGNRVRARLIDPEEFRHFTTMRIENGVMFVLGFQ